MNTDFVKLTSKVLAFATAAVMTASTASAVEGYKLFESKGMQLERELVASNVGHIWGMVFLPDNTLLMTIKSGQLKRFNPSNGAVSNVSGAPQVADFGQGGLLDVALSPSFQADGRVYLTYAKKIGTDTYTTALGYGTLEGNVLKGFRDIFIAQNPSSKGEHFGGRLVVDNDSTIWLTVGERNDRTNAQRLDNHLGKVLRLTAEGKAHPNNPFINDVNAKPEIFSYGHRNPQGLAWIKATGEIWESEHGPKGGDEVNHIFKGQNYGWPRATYGKEYTGETIGQTEVEGLTGPNHYWVPSIAPSGMIVYSGDLMPAWKGLFISGALALTHFNLLEIRDGKSVSEERLFADEGMRIREIEQGPGGEVYFSTDSGYLFRVRPAQ